MRKMVGMLILASAAGAAPAQAADFGLYGTAGTLGFGGGIAAAFGSHVGMRIGYTTYEYDISDIEESDLRLDGTAEIGGAHALLDWHPFGGGFRLSVGAVENAELSVRAEPIAGTYTLNGVTYSADDVGQATGTAKYDSFAPYAGFGFGRALSLNGRFSFSADLGVAFTGSPTLSLDATCLVPNASVCAQIETDVAAEQVELQKDADELKYWPVLSLGLSYRF